MGRHELGCLGVASFTGETPKEDATRRRLNSRWLIFFGRFHFFSPSCPQSQSRTRFLFLSPSLCNFLAMPSVLLPSSYVPSHSQEFSFSHRHRPYYFPIAQLRVDAAGRGMRYHKRRYPSGHNAITSSLPSTLISLFFTFTLSKPQRNAMQHGSLNRSSLLFPPFTFSSRSTAETNE